MLHGIFIHIYNVPQKSLIITCAGMLSLYYNLKLSSFTPMKNGACAGIFTLWLLNIAMENGPYKDDFPIKTFIYKGFSIAMLVITRPGITDFCRLSQT